MAKIVRIIAAAILAKAIGSEQLHEDPAAQEVIDLGSRLETAFPFLYY